MNDSYFTTNLFKVFAEDLTGAFLKAGFEIVEQPYIDYGFGGFRSTYIRRYILHQPTTLYDGILTTIIHVVGLPFGHRNQKILVLSAPRKLNNEPVCESMKLRIHTNDDGLPQVIYTDHDQQSRQTPATHGTKSTEVGSRVKANPTRNGTTDGADSGGNSFMVEQMSETFISSSSSSSKNNSNQSNRQQITRQILIDGHKRNQMTEFAKDLAKYVAHIIEAISPGLIQLPIEMKLEILKKLSVHSIIRMSQVNNEFRWLIFERGESLWRHLCNRDFGIKFINRLVHKSWMELYRDTYLVHQIEICRKERALPGLPERPALPPVPYRLQIEWQPEVLELPFYPINQLAVPDNPLQLALEFHPLRRASSLDSLP